MYQNNAAKFSTFAEENDKKAIFIKNETKDKVFILTGLDFGAHLVSRSPNLLRKLLFERIDKALLPA
mgnify:CR=1 FL=1